MKQRGRPSASALEIITTEIDRVERQKAPHDLTDEETEAWVSIVNSEPAEWFTPATAHLLSQYCRHAIHARRIAELLERACSDPELKVVDYDRLLNMQKRESAIMAVLATKMRLSQQSITNHRGNKKAGAKRKPWES